MTKASIPRRDPDHPVNRVHVKNRSKFAAPDRECIMIHESGVKITMYDDPEDSRLLAIYIEGGVSEPITVKVFKNE